MADPKLQAADSTSTPPQKYDALFFAPGTSLYYFTGVHWGLSERLLGLVIPREGAPIMVVPGIRRGPHARAAQDSARSSRLAGRRKPHQTCRTSARRSRDSLRAHRHRRNRRLHLLRSLPPCRARIRFRLRRSRDDRVPRAQIAARIGIDAARVRRDVRCVPRRLCITERRNVARRNWPLDRRRLRAK